MTTEATLLETANQSSSILEEHLKMNGWMPGWLAEIKENAWERYNQLPMPRSKDEAWRFGRTGNLNLEGIDLISGNASNDTVPVFQSMRENAGRIVMAHNTVIEWMPINQDFHKQGVIFQPLAEAIREHPDLVREHLFERLPDLGSEKFQSLHAALFENGVFLYVPKGVVIEQPMVIKHWATRLNGSVFPHTLLVTEENAQVSLVEFYGSTTADEKQFACGVADIYAGPSSNVSYHMIQNWNLNTTAFHLNSATAERDANLKTVTVNVGGLHIRNEQHGRILGKGAHIDMDSLGVVGGEQELDQRTLQTHAASNATSDLLYKNALVDKARTIFSGLIRVEQDAQQTDAYQTNRNLLLSPTADANSLPGLEIEANDVKCSHGATTSELDESNLFYFLSRGIPRRKAQELLVFGFFEEIISKIDNDDLAAYVRNLVQDKFSN